MSRATHQIIVPAGEAANPLLIDGVILPLVVSQHGADWDVVEEELDAEWVCGMRSYLEKFMGFQSSKPIGIYNCRVPGGARIQAKGDQVMATPTVDQVLAKYVETREEIKRLTAALDEQLAPLKEFQKKREEWMMGQLSAQGAQNIKTPHGTVYLSKTESVTMGDWDSFWAYVQETQQFNLLTHAVNKTAALEIMGEDRSQALPPGINYTAIRTVGVRKS